MTRESMAEATISPRGDGFDEAIAVLHWMAARIGPEKALKIGDLQYRVLEVHANPGLGRANGKPTLNVLFLVNDYLDGGPLQWSSIAGRDVRSLSWVYRVGEQRPFDTQMLLQQGRSDFNYVGRDMYCEMRFSTEPSMRRRRVAARTLTETLGKTIAEVRRRVVDEPGLRLYRGDTREFTRGLAAVSADAPITTLFPAYREAQRIDAAIDAALVSIASNLVGNLQSALVHDDAAYAPAIAAGYRFESITTWDGERARDAVTVTRKGVPALPITASGSADSEQLDVATARILIREISDILAIARRTHDRGLGG